MSTAIARNFQIGIDPTPTNNFTLYQPATPDGTLRLGNGNTGITSSLLTLTSAGNLGVGTSSPTSISGYRTLSLNGSTSGLLDVQCNGVTNGYIYASGSGLILDGKGGTSDLIFSTNGAERMRVQNSSGNVGIGTSSPATRLDVNGTATTTALTVNGNNISAVNSLGFRNRIINGDMRIDQRNNGASVTPTTSAYTVDRWQYQTNVASRISVQQNAGAVTPPVGFTNYLGSTTVVATTPATTDVFLQAQKVEGFNCSDFSWGSASAVSVTLSFWVRSSLTGTHSGSITNNAGNRSYVFTFTVNSANTWEQKTITIPGDTSGSWMGANNSTGLVLYFNLGTGTTFTTGTANAWQAGNFVGLTGAVQVVGTNGAAFYITGVQLEVGTVATPFERRDYGRELILCQRYFQRCGNGLTNPRISAGGSWASSTVAYVSIPLLVTMRAVPTMSVPSLGRVLLEGVNWYAATAASLSGETSPIMAIVLLNVASSAASAGLASSWGGGGSSAIDVLFSSEL